MGLRRGAASGGAQSRCVGRRSGGGAVQGRSAGLCRGVAWGRTGAQRAAARWWGGCAGAQRVAVHGRSAGLCRGAAAWGRAGAQRGAAPGGSVGPWRGATWGCAGAQRAAAQWWGGCVGVQRHGGALGRSVWLYRGALRGCAGAQQRGAAQGRSAEQPRGAVWGRGGAQQRGLCRGAVAWGCAGAQRPAAQWWEAAQGRIMGPRMGAARSCARVQQRGAAQSSCLGRRGGGGAV